MFRRDHNWGPDSGAVLEAMSRALAIIEFDPKGNILFANDNFCSVMGYALQEIRGRHHSLFVDPAYAQSQDYHDFWARFARGEFDAREYKRIGKGGKEVWIQASYNPVVNGRGVVTKVVKVAADVTSRKLANAEFEGKVRALGRVQAIIEFSCSGEVLTANDLFCTALGYSLQDIAGRHHSIFVEPAYAKSPEYVEFWRKLNSGEFVAAEFKRLGKAGREVWIAASYHPIFDLNNKVAKVVKFATDITDRVRAVSEIGEGLHRLAENDLEREITQPFGQAFEKLRLDFNASLAQLRTTLQQVSRGASNIRSGATELSTATNTLSQRTEQQAASLEETAAALEEITATVKKSSEGATHASAIAATANRDAQNSAEVVRKAVEAMDGISNSSTQIGRIIGVIDEIAFQTSLLALNAGVEAARAGEAGRGFAVVASEVRALAQRSAEAAKEIKILVSTSSDLVDNGVRLVDDAGASLARIMSQVAEINELIGDIASGAVEQSTAIAQVNVAVNQMDQMTQQNAAMVEESAAAGDALSQEATSLADLVGQFRIGASAAALRSELRRTVPHAFAQPSPTTRSPSSNPRGRSVEPVRQARAAGSRGSSADWEEF